MAHNPLGECALAINRGGGPTVPCQEPLCIRAGRVECDAGHPQPGHWKQKEIDDVLARRARMAAPPAEPPVAPYQPEPTWATLTKRIAEAEKLIGSLAIQVAALVHRLESLEADLPKRVESGKRKTG